MESTDLDGREGKIPEGDRAESGGEQLPEKEESPGLRKCGGPPPHGLEDGEKSQKKDVTPDGESHWPHIGCTFDE